MAGSPHQTCTRWTSGKPASRGCSRSRSKVTWYAHFLGFLEWATPSLTVWYCLLRGWYCDHASLLVRLFVRFFVMLVVISRFAWSLAHIKLKLKPNKALDENSSLSYGVSPAIWDHTVLPATRHKLTRPALTPASKLVFDLPTPEGWKAELT